MEPTSKEIHDFLKIANVANDKAAVFIKKKIAYGFTIEKKEDDSYVTNADTGAERIIRREIEKAYPDHDITGEELGASNKNSDYRWFIDPIDGTSSFRLGLPFYGSIIFLCYKGQPIMCTINHPSLKLRYHAILGEGAYRNKKRMMIMDIPVSDVKDELIATCANQRDMSPFCFTQQVFHPI